MDAKEPPPTPVAKLCPDHLKTSRHSVTCAMYNSTGRSVLASYNDEDMYTFDVKSGKRESFGMKKVTWNEKSYENNIFMMQFSSLSFIIQRITVSKDIEIVLRSKDVLGSRMTSS